MDGLTLRASACPDNLIAALRLERSAVHLHRLGARPVPEFLAELGREHGIEADILRRLEAWRGTLTPELVDAVGARDFPRRIVLVPEAQS